MNLFVYGTLKQGYGNSHYLKNSKYIGQGELTGYEIYDLGFYPGIKEEKNFTKESSVIGEIYIINETELRIIDRLEGEGYLYLRKSEKIKMNNGELIDAFVYVFNHSVEGRRKLDKLWEGRNRDVKYNQRQ